MASHRRVGSSFFQPSCTAVSRPPIATSTPEWCDAAAVGSTIRPKRRFVYRRAIRGIDTSWFIVQRDMGHGAPPLFRPLDQIPHQTGQTADV